jgi:hypothetical protein
MIPLLATCATCKSAFEIRFEKPSDISLLSHMLVNGQVDCVCPRKCTGRIAQQAQFAEGVFPLSVTVQELFQAVSGMPLPDEVPKSAIFVLSLLKSERVLEARCEEEGGSIFLHSITLTNGCTIHLCASGRGPQVLKITRPV